MAGVDAPVEAGRKPYLAGNWKMNGTRAGLRSYLSELAASPTWAAAVDGEQVDLALYLPATLLLEALPLAGPVRLGGQTLHPADHGAYTGELSAAHWLDAGASTVLIGHSERRTLFGEDDGAVAERLATALAAGLVPVLCVGESLEERRAGQADDRVCTQLEACRAIISAAEQEIIVAYEPVWAIGTGETATPEQAQAMHQTVRGWLAEVSADRAASTRLLYGGSVNAGNVSELLAQPDIDGALVGGASLKAESFAAIGQTVLD